MGLFFEMLGGPRTMGAIFGWLMICEPSHQSITEIAGSLGVSKASVSSLVRQLEASQMVERVPVSATRQHHYQITEGGFAQVIERRRSRARFAVDAAELGLTVVGPERPEQRERLAEFRDFYTFLDDDASFELVRRWEEYRKRRRDGGHG
jgi:DNA-binding transcriptional regulator GbsR (MarR family)